jgi:hypothetical protein
MRERKDGEGYGKAQSPGSGHSRTRTVQDLGTSSRQPCTPAMARGQYGETKTDQFPGHSSPLSWSISPVEISQGNQHAHQKWKLVLKAALWQFNFIVTIIAGAREKCEQAEI